MASAEKNLTIINELGLHVRPAGMMVKVANRFKSKIILEKDEDRVDAKSIMGVMMLGASKGSIIRVHAEGEDAEEAVRALEELFENGFGELESCGG